MLEALAALVRDTGRALTSWRQSDKASGTWVGTQLKTEGDAAAHAMLAEGLARLAPATPIVSEEDAASHGPSRPSRYFLIDPIDGTASWSGGFAGWVTQVALMQSDRPVLAAVFAPTFDHLFLAERGRGATLNDRRLALASAGERKILIDNYPQPRGRVRAAFEAVGCTGYVESGSIALKICRVADGTADLFFKDVPVRDWDVAPAHLVLEEAGGVLKACDGSAFVYEGSYEKPGVIATRRPADAAALAQWCVREMRMS